MALQRFWSYKIYLYVAIILKFVVNLDNNQRIQLEKHYLDDVSLCPKCFPPKTELCTELAENITFTGDFVDYFNFIFGVKPIYYGSFLNSSEKVVVKYYGRKNFLFNNWKTNQLPSSSYKIMQHFYNIVSEKLPIEGAQFCPITNLKYFIDLVRENRTTIETWMQFFFNIQAIMLPILKRENFPVPKVYGNCGFTLYESYEGAPLSKYLDTKFEIKLGIVKQMLEAAIQFTNGFYGYRIYLTDLTLDNIVYNEKTNKISFVDLDTIIIVDSLHHFKNDSVFWSQSHQHDVLECDGSFSYIPEEICQHHESDINIFSVCQLLLEDLHCDKAKGFLNPIPTSITVNFPELMKELEICVRCSEIEKCTSRFESIQQILDIIDKMLL